MNTKIKHEKRIRRHKRVRAKISGTSKVPRLCVFRSNKHIYAQLVDDEKSHTILAAADMELLKSEIKNLSRAKSSDQKPKTKKKKTEPALAKDTEVKGKVAIAYEVGKLIAQKAEKKKIKKVVFDRGGYRYHGRVKALAQGAREEGLKF